MAARGLWKTRKESPRAQTPDIAESKSSISDEPVGGVADGAPKAAWAKYRRRIRHGLVGVDSSDVHTLGGVARHASQVASLTLEDVNVHRAAFAGNAERMRQWMAAGGSLFAPNEYGYTALTLAIAANRRLCAATLIHTGGHVSAVDASANMPIHVAAALGHCSMIELLHGAGVNLDMRTPDTGETAFTIAFAAGHWAAAATLVRLGASMVCLDGEGWATVHHVAATGNATAVSTLVAMSRGELAQFGQPRPVFGANRESVAQQEKSAAVSRVSAGALEPDDPSSGASPDANASGWPSRAAARRQDARTTPPARSLTSSEEVQTGPERGELRSAGRRDGASRLVSDLLTVTVPDGETALHLAVAAGHTAVVEVLVAALAAEPSAARELILARDAMGRTALHEAARHGRIRALHVMLRALTGLELRQLVGSEPPLHGIDSESKDGLDTRAVLVALESAARPPRLGEADARVLREAEPGGVTPLADAVVGGNFACALVLLRAGISPNTPARESGDSPLHEAAFEGHVELAQLLVCAGADLTARNRVGQLALHVGAARGHVLLVRVLLAVLPESVNAIDSSRLTALHWAALHGHAELARALVAAGASREALSDRGATPAALARYAGFAALATELE